MKSVSGVEKTGMATSHRVSRQWNKLLKDGEKDKTKLSFVQRVEQRFKEQRVAIT